MKNKIIIRKFLLTSIFCSTVLSIGLSYGISLRCKPTEFEKVDILFCAYSFDSKSNRLQKLLKEKCPNNIREVNFNFVSLNSTPLEFNNSLIYHMDTMDLFVLPESLMASKLPHLRQDFNQEVFKNKVGNPPLDKWYIENNLVYGFCVYDKEIDKGYISSYISYTENGKDKENYYMFFRKDSPQGGVITNSSYEACFDVIKGIFAL